MIAFQASISSRRNFAKASPASVPGSAPRRAISALKPSSAITACRCSCRTRRKSGGSFFGAKIPYQAVAAKGKPSSFVVGTCGKVGTRASLAAGCEVVLHCTGVMAEMEEVAASASPLTEAAMARIAEVAAGLAVDFEPFELSFSRPALWRGGLSLAIPETVPPALTALHARLAEALQTLALPVERRPFKPHLTLARTKEGERQFGQTLAKSGVSPNSRRGIWRPFSSAPDCTSSLNFGLRWNF